MQGYNNCDHIYSFGNGQGSGLGTGCLWLGDFNSARNKKLHREKGFQTIITAGLGMKLAISDPIKHRLYPLYDHPNESIEKYPPAHADSSSSPTSTSRADCRKGTSWCTASQGCRAPPR